MKKTICLLASLLMLFVMRLNAQNERILLFECFTNASCPPCAQMNPALDALINNNADRVAAIKYHMSWPVNNDPMYLQNTTDNDARKNVYQINSVPWTVVDGIRYNYLPNGLNQSTVNSFLAIDSPYEMRLGYEVDTDANTVTVHVLGQALADITGPLKLYVGVIEKEIHYPTPPGNNGEKDFYSVMKKLLPTASGTSLGSVEEGDYFAYTFTWEMANVYDVNQIDAIAWIQNTTTKEVMQACKSSASIEPYFEHEAAVSDVTNIKSMNCSGSVEPSVTLTNNGTAALTTAELEILVNDEVQKVVEWSGNLGLFESTVVELGEVTFPVEDENTLTVRITSVDGVADEGPLNNEASLSFKGSPANSGLVIKLVLRTDGKPQETTWKLTNLGTGEVVLEGGPYDEAGHTYNEILEITGDGCYDFTIYDAGGDGLSSGGGMYGVKAGSKTLFSGKEFGDSESNEFSYEVYAGAEEVQEASSAVYPNPTSGTVTIVCQGEQAVTVYNMTGQCVFTGVAHGQLLLDLGVFGSGVYAVKVGDRSWRTVVK